MYKVKNKGWRGESHRHYLASKGVKTKSRDEITRDLEQFKRKFKDREVTQQDFNKQVKKAAKIAILGIDEDKGFRPIELILPSSKNEAEVAKAIFLRVQLRKQNKAKLAKAKTPEERKKIQAQIKENNKKVDKVIK